jgi:hypothetical protein
MRRMHRRGEPIPNAISNPPGLRAFFACAFVAASLCLATGGGAQTSKGQPLATPAAPVPPLASDLPVAPQSTPLPDSPAQTEARLTVHAASPPLAPVPAPGAPVFAVTVGPGMSIPEASHTRILIQPDQRAPRLNAGDKALLGIRNAFSPFVAVGWFTTSGYEQITNSSPNYGAGPGAYGRRLGATAALDSSEEIFSDSLMAPIFHEDPRYYRLGPSRNFARRVLYATTQPLIARTDQGRNSPNFALQTGTLAGAGLSNAYYPPVNRGGAQTFETFATSIGGSAIADFIREFFGDVTAMLHPPHK